MSDVLRLILADPELQQWPRQGGHSAAIPGAPESGQNSGADVAAVTVPDDAQTAITKMRALIAADDNSAAASDDRNVDHDDRDWPPSPPAAATDSADNAYRDDINNTDGRSIDADAPTTPMSFDDITQRPHVLTDKLGAGIGWLKDRNWKSPKTLGVAAAAIVAVTAAGLWATSAGRSETQPTAQPAAPTATADPAPRGAPADAAIPVTEASARCPAPSSDPMNALRPTSTEAWICVRAWQVDGQILDLTLDGPYVITAVRIMPGVNTEVDGQDQWLKYRTVRWVGWEFNDPAHTTVDQDTHDRRELLTQPVTPKNCSGDQCRLVASHVVVTIEKTDEPVNPRTLPTPTATAAGADYTAFGVSRIEIVGHPAR
jgi:hypothetical protein